MERRLIKTHLSKKPLPSGLAVSMGMILLCTLTSLAYWNIPSVSTYLAANQDLVLNHYHIWRLLTSTLVHGDMGHLLSNSYMLGILSYFVFGYFGWTVYPFAIFILSAFVNLFTLMAMPESIFLIGASGMVYCLAGFWLTLYIFIERQRSFTQRFVRSFGVALVTLFPTSLEPQTSYKAHAIGFLVGLLFAIYYFLTHKTQIRNSEKWQIIFDEEDSYPFPQEPLPENKGTDPLHWN